jgi:hypothetical protein
MEKMFLLEEMYNKYSSIKDDEPCLCGSGKRFSECHKVYIENAEDNPFNIYKRTRKIKKDKKCYYKDEFCNGIYTFSHSIPRQSLNNIAEEGHVLRFDLIEPNQSQEVLNTFSMEPKKIGINEVGCYYGFCGYHDTEVFKKIELDSIVPNLEQVVLTRLRSLTNELYVKSQSLKLIPILNDITASKDSKEIKNILGTYSAQFFSGSYKAIGEFENQVKILREDVSRKKFDKYSSIVFVFDSEFPIQCCALVNPIFSIGGEIIQDLNNLEMESEFFSLNSFFKDEQTFVIFVWKRDSILDYFFTEILQIDNEYLPNFILQFILAYSENHALKITWWNDLSIIKRKRLIRIFFEDILEHQDLKNPINNFRRLLFTSSKLLYKKCLNVNSTF